MHAVQKMREAKGLSRTQLATRSGLSYGAVYELETNHSGHKTRIETAELIAKALESEVRNLFHPGDLSDRGRPPQTGRPVTKRAGAREVSGITAVTGVASTTAVKERPVCEVCNFQKSVTDACNCP